MPSGRSKIHYRVVCTGDGGREWRVYKLRRQYRLFKKVRLWSNARLELHVPDKKPRKPEFLRRENGARTDARVWVRELGGYVCFHRLAACAWQRGRYPGVGSGGRVGGHRAGRQVRGPRAPPRGARAVRRGPPV